MLKIINLYKDYKTKDNVCVNALNGLNLNLPNYGLFFITGKSGSGKSTLLNILGGLDSPTSGDVFIDNLNINRLNNKQLDAYRRNYVGFIFQNYNLIKYLYVYENIKLSK